MSPTEPGRSGARIGTVPFLCVVVFGALTLIPATRPVGTVLLLLLALPALVGWLRARRLTDGSRGLTSANAVLCGLLFVVGVALSPSPLPAPPAEISTGTSASQTVPDTVGVDSTQAVAPAPTAVAPAPDGAASTQAVAPAPTAAPVAPRLFVAPPRQTPSSPAPHSVETPSRTATSQPGASCGADSYINADGNCVHRPVAAPSAPSGATAQCKDGTYSFSQHRQGTCSGHGGVSHWL